MSDHQNVSVLTIQSLFQSAQSIRIPSYQRAYSWESKKQCVQFLEDLLEQQGKQYYLGQFLFEKDDHTLFIIDGQQRLTTTILFFAALASVQLQHQQDIQHLKNTYLNDVFETIDEDQWIFKRITQDNIVDDPENSDTHSQKRLILAFNFFQENLKKYELAQLSILQEALEQAVISQFHITSKAQATQVFEYQNNRGKELSQFEIIKAHLMHQIYIYSIDNQHANKEIDKIQKYVTKTYRHFEFVDGYFTERELLENYYSLFYPVTSNIHDDIKNLLSKITDKSEKVQWIANFFEYFSEITYCAKSIVNQKDNLYIQNLFLVGNTANWKIILLAIYYTGQNQNSNFKPLLKLLEVLCFKLKLGDYRSDHLPSYAKDYIKNKNIDQLYKSIKYATEKGFKWYWETFPHIIQDYFIKQNYHYDRNTIKFILWQYENMLREKNRSGILLNKELFNSYTIEHICPQNPKDIPHSKEFIKNHLHLAGNLALLTQSQNSKFGNKSFEEKQELFQDTVLTSYSEIRAEAIWTESEITKRHENIVKFVQQYFDISAL
ncbi:DUF262 domain-containing HNH endonuclease family protein [Acinetobacter sp. VNK23]|uniref:DUF262 domain-containing protein n=1 Tax=Acinetobacter thutiue TaxID=2998078 RepID=UPI002574DAB3|nr:DUF262 domain-containing HNH endonuclease family protein [Acinetobacter thutiue]MDM1021310.1 DUF262 domain-containing HNH endonuclease family protein [Acinetobacter thutiue]